MAVDWSSNPPLKSEMSPLAPFSWYPVDVWHNTRTQEVLSAGCGEQGRKDGWVGELVPVIVPLVGMNEGLGSWVWSGTESRTVGRRWVLLWWIHLVLPALSLALYERRREAKKMAVPLRSVRDSAWEKLCLEWRDHDSSWDLPLASFFGEWVGWEPEVSGWGTRGCRLITTGCLFLLPHTHRTDACLRHEHILQITHSGTFLPPSTPACSGTLIMNGSFLN